VRIVFMGSPRFAVFPLLGLVRVGHEVIVYTQPDRPAGRGQRLYASPVKQAATEHGLRVVQPEGFKRSPETVRDLAELRPEVIVVAAFGQILPPVVLEIPRWGCLNIHPSLLPRYRGAAPVPAAILAGDEFTGVSIMLLDAGMDTGPVFCKVQIPVLGYDTTATLTDKLSRIGGALLLELLSRYLQGELTPRSQDAAGATYCRPVAREDGEIDWRLPAVEIWRRVRAYHPWPGAYTAWAGKRLKILEAFVPEETCPAAPGTVVDLGGKAAGFGVVTGVGVLGVLRVQLEGKQAVAAADFMRGQRGFIGARLALSRNPDLE